MSVHSGWERQARAQLDNFAALAFFGRHDRYGGPTDGVDQLGMMFDRQAVKHLIGKAQAAANPE
ncbi:MAG: hypothetical protein AUI14_07310 [Actinobacteria bacterium 13_2_20CM_2_71_6]|nr:MAG: hypothetical protein AUI14_07310 [Actinobacteria bacterium 13_2_20CM_2_71_6]